MHRKNERFIERLPLLPDQRVLAYGLSLVLSLLALGMRVAANPWLPPGFPYVTFFPAVILSSFLFGAGPGIFSALLCGFFALHFFVIPAAHGVFSLPVLVATAFYTFVVVVDIALVHWMQRANYKLALERERSRALAETRELLFQELQHRVSNNLQVVGAMIALQRRTIGDEQARKAMDDAAARIALIGKISRGLYSVGETRQPLDELISRLARDVIETAGRSDVALHIKAPTGLELSPDSVVPLALIVAEAINNAIEHGLAERNGGSIGIEVQADGEGRALLAISDNGAGLGADFEASKERNLGLRIASTLARQLRGEFSLANGPLGGAQARLTFALGT